MTHSAAVKQPSSIGHRDASAFGIRSYASPRPPRRWHLMLWFCVALLALAGCEQGGGHDDHAGHGDHKGHEDGKHEDHAKGDDDHKGEEGHDDDDDHKGEEGHDDDDDHKGEEGHDGDDDHKGEEGHDDGDKGDDDHKEEGHEGHDDEEEAVRLTKAAIKRSGIRVVPAASGSLKASVEVPAEVQLNPDRVAHISPLVEGQLLTVEVTLGDAVKAEQQLARMRSVELGQARAELSRANALRNVARKTLKRQEQLRSEGITSERAFLDAELAYDQAGAERAAAQSRLRVFGARGGSGPDMALTSPIGGVILERHATRGESVSREDTLFVVADMSRVWVIGRVYEQHVGQISAGMTASLTLNAYPNRTWSGVVDFVGDAVDEETRTLPVRVELNNPDGLLRPGLFGTLRLSAFKDLGATVLLPKGAIQTLENRSVVFVPGHDEGEFEAIPVTLGRSSQGQVEVLAGLKPGASVVVSGAFVLKSELVRGQLGHGHAH